MAAETSERCPICQGTGWAIERRDGREVAVPCRCRRERSRAALLRAGHIPARYLHCTTESFQLWNAKDPSLKQARNATRRFIDAWPRVEKGLLFTGRTGTGKTHLAVAAVQELILTKGVRGLYVNFVELVLQLQMSFDSGGGNREEILSPVVNAELLVLDELGAGKPTPWVLDLLYYVVNARYMEHRITLFTTNFKDSTPREGGEDVLRREESLADRVSATVRSRLYEMCQEVKLYGDDYRLHVLAAQREH